MGFRLSRPWAPVSGKDNYFYHFTESFVFLLINQGCMLPGSKLLGGGEAVAEDAGPEGKERGVGRAELEAADV